jgi:hypothetical protein
MFPRLETPITLLEQSGPDLQSGKFLWRRPGPRSGTGAEPIVGERSGGRPRAREGFVGTRDSQIRASSS